VCKFEPRNDIGCVINTRHRTHSCIQRHTVDSWLKKNYEIIIIDIKLIFKSQIYINTRLDSLLWIHHRVIYSMNTPPQNKLKHDAICKEDKSINKYYQY
jgi:hypothetical protein